MKTNVAQNLVRLRKTRGLTQQYLANLLQVSRPTYINFENGKTEPGSGILARLANFYGITSDELLLEPRNNEKFQQMYLYILTKLHSTTKTKLAKLLYLADFWNFYSNGEPMSGVRYIKREYGPVADIFFETTDDLFDRGEINITPRDSSLIISLATSRPQTDLLTDSDRSFLDELTNLWRDKRTAEIVRYTHDQKAWASCRMGEIIPYTLVIQEDPDHVYRPFTTSSS